MTVFILVFLFFFFVKQKTAYEMRISDWSSDVCSSDLHWHNPGDWRSFDDFLAALTHKKRKNIRAERRLVHASGLHFRRLSGAQIGTRECAEIGRAPCRERVCQSV